MTTRPLLTYHRTQVTIRRVLGGWRSGPCPFITTLEFRCSASQGYARTSFFWFQIHKKCRWVSVSIRLVPTGSVPTPAGRYRPGYRPAPVGKRGNRERGAVALPTGRAVGTDRRWSRARSVPAGRYRPGRSVPTRRPVGCHMALCDWPTAATSASRCN